MRNLTHNFYNRPFFRADVHDGTVELLVYDEIGENTWTGAGVTVKAIKQQLDQAGDYSDILIRINSPGGDVFESIAVYNLLRSTAKPIEVRVDGLAASAASIVAMAGDKIIMGASSMLMVHEAWAMCIGYAEDMRAMAESLCKISDSIAKIYQKRTKRSLADIKELMKAETWMTAAEALENRFCTEIEQEPDEQIAENALAIARRFRSLARFEHTPQRYRAGAADLCNCECNNCTNGNCEACTNEACDDKNCEDCPMQAKADVNDLEAKLAKMDMALRS